MGVPSEKGYPKGHTIVVSDQVMLRVFFVSGLVGLSACNAAVGVSGVVNVPPDAAKTCASHCAGLGLQLSAVAIMANNVGCVCQPRSNATGAVAANYGAGTTAGMATLAMQEVEEEQRAQQRSTRR